MLDDAARLCFSGSTLIVQLRFPRKQIPADADDALCLGCFVFTVCRTGADADDARCSVWLIRYTRADADDLTGATGR